ncbi:MAG: hypothetical protein AUH30_10725 [Candidatus Rokubacteria bacterium 13_1_40CM_68_15]|nr:MAG: hypothetical protein AUH30_10725 [Candidatus Rokubacteria bacterium 13_1_40CM_68_15]
MSMLAGKTALVTGAGRGIGRGIALALAKAGAKVVVNDLGVSLSGDGGDKQPAAQVVDEIVKGGGSAAPNFGSVADSDDATAMVNQVVDTWGRIDILVHVAGILRDRMIFNMTDAEWDAVLGVHLKGAFNNMSSVSALGAPGQPNYAAAKAGILGLTWSTANALAKYGITANAILPSGATRMIDSTPRGREFFEQTGKWPSEAAVGTERDPDNVAPLVVFLASDAAADITGQAFHSFGYGYTLMAQPQAVRRLEADRRLTPEELATLFATTLGPALKPPPGTNFGKTLGTRPAAEWKDLGSGVRFWQWGREER